MYAVIKTGGKQYRIAAGEKLKIEQIPADIGAEIVLDQVLLVADGDNLKMGRPLVAGAALFGIGWGLAGFCPGPAITTLANGKAMVSLFVAAMIAGMVLYKLFDRWRSGLTDG